MTRASDLEQSIAKNKAYAANYVRAGKDPAKYEAKIAAETAELAALKAAPAAAAVAAPAATAPAAKPSGLTQYAAAEVDAGFVFQASLGNTVGADTNPAPGAAKAMGFSGVVADSQGAASSYGIFKVGVLVETVTSVPPLGWGFPFGVTGNGDEPYTGPGAVRP